MDKQEKKGIAIGAAIGAVVGVVTGILFAPKSGKETRQDIKHAAEKAVDKVEEEAKKLVDEAKVLIEKAENKAKDLKGKASQSAKSHVDEASHTAKGLAAALKAFRSGEASDKDLKKAIQNAKEAQAALKVFLKKR